MGLGPAKVEALLQGAERARVHHEVRHHVRVPLVALRRAAEVGRGQGVLAHRSPEDLDPRDQNPPAVAPPAPPKVQVVELAAPALLHRVALALREAD